MNMVMTGSRRREKKSIYDYTNREILRILSRCFYLKDMENLSNEELHELQTSEKIVNEYLEHRDLFESLIPRKNSEETLQKLAKVEKEVEEKLNEKFKDEPQGMGFCHTYWDAKKRILKEDYGIEWFSPAECNPTAMYD